MVVPGAVEGYLTAWIVVYSVLVCKAGDFFSLSCFIDLNVSGLEKASVSYLCIVLFDGITYILCGSD
jgi:hypothetical protein